MLNILIPMAGRGSRFEQAGFTFPKPLIEVNGKPMIQVVVENIGLKGKYIFLVLKEHYDKYALKYLLPLITKPNPCEIVIVDSVTEGAACTALLAKQFINNDEPLLIANSDQYIEWDSSHFIATVAGADASILLFEATHPKWSFAKIENDIIIEVAEKRPISTHATCGIYYFKHGKMFVDASKQMIKKNIRTNNEFYICPVFNELISGVKGIKYKIKPYFVDGMLGLGTPEDLNIFLNKHKE